MLRPVPRARPAANPVRSDRFPGRTPRFDTFPYDRPPFSATLPCAGANVVSPASPAMRQVSVRVMVIALPSVWGATPGREALLRNQAVQDGTATSFVSTTRRQRPG